MLTGRCNGLTQPACPRPAEHCGIPPDVKFLGTADRTTPAALALAPALLRHTEQHAVPAIAASVIPGPCIVLGAHQHAGRVVDLDACAAARVPVLRRATSGTAAWIAQRALHFTLALPDLTVLASDATPATLLNRHVRGFLRGFSRAGALAHYFGREWIAVQRRGCVLLGYEDSPRGGVLIELLAGFDAPIGLPPGLATDRERALDRWRGRAPIALEEACGPRATPHDVADRVIESVASYYGSRLDEIDTPALTPMALDVTAPSDPLPVSAVFAPPTTIPIGYLDAAWVDKRVWLGGDVLATRRALDAISASLDPESESLSWVTGANEPDLLRAIAAARAMNDR